MDTNNVSIQVKYIEYVKLDDIRILILVFKITERLHRRNQVYQVLYREDQSDNTMPQTYIYFLTLFCCLMMVNESITMRLVRVSIQVVGANNCNFSFLVAFKNRMHYQWAQTNRGGMCGTINCIQCMQLSE